MLSEKCSFIAVMFKFALSPIGLHITFCSYKKLAIFTTNADAENQCLINHKCVCGALNRQFLVGAVSSSGFFLCHNVTVSISINSAVSPFVAKYKIAISETTPTNNFAYLISKLLKSACLP